MAMLNITQAARAAGVDRATVHRALKSGRLSATVDDTGARAIDTAELHRVFPLRATGDPVTAGDPVTVAAPTGPGVLEQARQADELVAVLRERVRGLEEQRELYRQQLQAAQAAMEVMTLRLPPPAPAQVLQEPVWPVVLAVTLAVAAAGAALYWVGW
jgi:hypothetical protein